jgi:hypothetical protein
MHEMNKALESRHAALQAHWVLPCVLRVTQGGGGEVQLHNQLLMGFSVVRGKALMKDAICDDEQQLSEAVP